MHVELQQHAAAKGGGGRVGWEQRAQHLFQQLRSCKDCTCQTEQEEGGGYCYEASQCHDSEGWKDAHVGDDGVVALRLLLQLRLQLLDLLHHLADVQRAALTRGRN